MSKPITAKRLAAQFYTLRDLTKTPEGFRDALKRVAEIGYGGVQISAVAALNEGLVSPAECRSWLDEFGLKCVATHRSFESLQNDLEGEVAFHKTLGCDYVAIGGFLHIFPNSPEGFRRFIKEAIPLAEALANQGIRFGIHNHDGEFRRTNGVLHYDVLINERGPHLALEIDTYWVVKAGVDCAELIKKSHGRVPMIHVKDLEMSSSPEQPGAIMAPVGEGNLPWDRILRAGEAAGVEVYIVEQDDTYRDPFDCLKSSFDFLSAWEIEGN